MQTKLSTKQNIKEQVESLLLLDTTKRKKHLFVDISDIVNHNINTGIQRVVKQQLYHLLNSNQEDFIVKPVYLRTIDNYSYFLYANNYLAKFTSTTTKLQDIPIQLQEGDILYSADLSYQSVQKATNLNIYKQYKSIGVKILFLIHDILPITHPHYFAKEVPPSHKQWLHNILSISDKLITTTQTGKKELQNYLTKNHLNIPPITPIHLGSDLPTDKKQNSLKMKNNTKQINFLTVGTLEPRKAHAQLLKAFEILWAQNLDINLTIVGKKGWMMQEFLEALTSHPQLDKKLFYLNSIDDNHLNQLYNTSDALIVPSNAEGFGLPLIEAAKHKLPIITRDIEVFREIATTHAFYFKDTNKPQDIANSIKEWLQLYKQNSHPTTIDMPIKTWKQNAKQLLELIVKN